MSSEPMDQRRERVRHPPGVRRLSGPSFAAPDDDHDAALLTLRVAGTTAVAEIL
jgi:hypothetical protein